MHHPLRWLALLAALIFLAPPASPQDDKKNDKQDELKARAKEYTKIVTEIRGLDFTSEVGVGVYSREDLKKFITAEAERDFPRSKAKKYEKAYAHFALIPPDLDLYDASISLMTESIAGFYHPKSKELKLIASSAKAGSPEAEIDEKVTFVHELAHAAQDQNFDLITIPLEEEYNDDMVAAVKCLVEGEASLVGWLGGLGARFDIMRGMIISAYKSGKLPGEADKLPVYLKEPLTFSYGWGLQFIITVKKAKGGGWDAITKMYEDLPSSTTQILHPKKYYEKRENPIDLTLPTVGDGYELLANNVHGEFCIGILLRELKAGKKRDCEKAAEGWRGDRWHVVEKNGMVSSLWLTTWESEETAKRFFEAYHKALGNKYKSSTESEATETKTVLAVKPDSGKDLAALLERKGQDVLVIDGDPELLKKAGLVWEKTKREELVKVPRFKRGTWTCARHPKVEKDINSYCPECGERLVEKKLKK